ncbi:FMN-binding negative transcriptional regulator [Afipia sp. TerB]
MYVPPVSRIDRAASLAFAAARGFGLVCAYDGGKPVASPVPFHIEYGRDGTPLVCFHLARHNPLIGLADGVGPWLFAVSGPDAYVSADWYVSPDQVPTWLYQAVHMTGPVRPMTGDGLAEHLDLVSARFENELAPKRPWTMDKMSAGRREAMMKGIVGLVMSVEEVEGSFKLNQHKSDADHVAVTAALALQKSTDARDLSNAMHAMRPQAFAAVENDAVLDVMHEGIAP